MLFMWSVAAVELVSPPSFSLSFCSPPCQTEDAAELLMLHPSSRHPCAGGRSSQSTGTTCLALHSHCTQLWVLHQMEGGPKLGVFHGLLP